MVYRTVLIVILLSLLLPIPTAAVTAEDGWQAVGRGIEYREYVLPGPVRAFVTRMDRQNPTVTIETALANGYLGGGMETVRGMVSRSEDTLNYWLDLGAKADQATWGKRSHVVVAINGSYIEKPDYLYPENGVIQSGWYAKRFTDYMGWSGFAWKMNGEAFIGDCVFHDPGKQVVRLSDGTALNIKGINLPEPPENSLVIYTPQKGRRTPSTAEVVEVVIQLTKPLMVTPNPQYVAGQVVDVREGKGGTPLEFDHVVLTATGSARQSLLSHAQKGDEVRISMETAHYVECDPSKGPAWGDWSMTYTSIGGNHTFLKNGEVIPYRKDTGRQPRTAVAMNEEYIYFIVVDGRKEGYSIGMTLEELGEFARDKLGADWAINQDGGGSSTMVINGKVVNNPSDLCWDRLENVFIPYASNNGHISGQAYTPDPEDFPVSRKKTGHCERGVPNALMMVEVQPMAQSTRFEAGQAVTTQEVINLRAGPGTNYPVLQTIPAGTQLVVQDQINGLNGVYATGYHWWRVSTGTQTGWAAEDYLR